MKVFISHNTADFECFVKPLADVLDQYEVDTWYSERDIPDGGDWPAHISKAIRSADYILVVISTNTLLNPGQIKNELRLAAQLSKRIITIKTTEKPLSSDLTYFLGLNAINWYQKTEADAYDTLFRLLGRKYNAERTAQDKTDRISNALSEMIEHTDPIFAELGELGGYSWGADKSIVQNLSGGWPLDKVRLEYRDDDMFDIEAQPYADFYREYLDSPEAAKIQLKGKNHTRWMLTEFDTAYDELFLSIRRTQWLHTQFIWHHLLKYEENRREAIETFFDEETSDYPTSLCLHLVLIDCENNIVGTRISGRKKDDYPRSIAVTLGEQLDETDHTSTFGFVSQWFRRAMTEEFGFTIADYNMYVDEASARIMSLTMEGDIYNFALTCCARLKCTTEELAEYYKIHRSFADEFNEVFPIPMKDVREILENSNIDSGKYHPSSYLRLLYGYLYAIGELPM